ncbi:MAG: tripartite tricarboxylate transporter substrate binding protein [Deltaproteobacteria bacterium]|nr:tripartite tricarboxylate transporter substrate binding protein [Deltaproteobacteria bacterium]
MADFRKALLAAPLVVLALSTAGLAESPEAFPSRPITFINPVPPGASSELSSRILAKEAEKFLGQPIVVVNKPGGSFAVGIGAIASAKPDGYTIGYTGHPGMFVTPLTGKVPYHPVKDFTQILQYGYMNVSVTVKGNSPFQSFKDLIAYARQNPKKLTYGSAGIGSFGHLAMEQSARRENVQFTHMPFKGSPETQAALLGGHILVGTGDFNPSLLDSGEIRLILLIADKHSPDYPKVPILKDMGYDIPAPTFLNVAGPKGIPDEIVKKLDSAFTRAMKEPAFVKGMRDLRFTLLYRNGKEMADYVAANYDLFAKILKEEGLIQ